MVVDDRAVVAEGSHQEGVGSMNLTHFKNRHIHHTSKSITVIGIIPGGGWP